MTIERLNGVLSAIGAPATTREVAEMLWLACYVTPPEAEGGARRPGHRGAARNLPLSLDPGAGPEGTGRPSGSRQAPDGGDAKTGLFPKASGGPVLNASQVLVPAAPMIGNALAIERALRPLKRTVPSEHESELDEDATATRIAGQPRGARDWAPVMRQAAERWLSLALVVDTGPSMQVWQPMAEELREVFARLAAFRELRTWYLRGGDIAATPDGLPQHPAGLINPSSRQAVLVLSDCSGPHWWDGRAQRALSVWGQQAATAILQPLPERLWRRSALPPVPGIAYLKTAGAPNSELMFSPHEGAAEPGVPVPVVEISPDWLTDLASLLLGPSGSPVQAAACYVSPAMVTSSAPLRRERQLPIAERVRRFQESASPEAVWLACCLAVSVPTLPVLRLIQHQMLGGRRGQPAHLAEVLLSGFLRPRDERRQAFEFVPGAREALIASMPRSQSWYVADVLSRISAEIEARAGRARDTFTAFQRVPEGTGGRTLRDEQPFALVSREAVQFLRRTVSPARPLWAPEPGGQRPGDQREPVREDSAGPATTTNATAAPAPAPGSLTGIYVSHVPADRPWADWIAGLLAQRGIRVVRTQADLGLDDLVRAEARRLTAAAVRTIAILSAAYLESPQAQGVWEAMNAVEPASAGRRLIPVRVGEIPVEPPWSERTMVDLTRRDAVQASEQLLRVLGDPPKLIEYEDRPDLARYPRTIPPVWNVPTRNATFAERNVVLERLHDQLNSSGFCVVLPVARSGVDSDETTQVALEYAHRFMADYEVVWWVPSAEAGLIAPALAELAPRLGMRTGPEPASAARAAMEALRVGRPWGDRWLLIFDDADDPDDIRDFLPGGPGHVIVTSRNPAWAQTAEPVEIGVFSRQESVDFLRRRVQGLTEADATLVAEALGDLPLAMEQAGAWLEATGMRAADYVALLEDQLAAAIDLSLVPEDPRPVSATWRVSFDRLREESPEAARLLELCSFLAPDSISMNLLNSDEMMEALRRFGSQVGDRSLLARLIRDMARYSLAKVDRGSNAISMHRLVQALIRDQMAEQDRADTMHEVHQILDGARPHGGIDSPDNWARYDQIWPHLEPSGIRDCDHEEIRSLLIDWVRYLWLRGEYDRALDEARDLERTWTHMLGSDDQQVLSLRFQIANVLRSQGSFVAAYEMDTETYRGQRQVLGDDHPATLMTASGLAADLRGAGRFREALELDEETYGRFRDMFGVDDPQTLSSADNLAVDLRLTGDCYRARDLDRETLDHRQAMFGPDHPYTLHSASMLARDLREAGDYEGSVELLAQTHERYRAILGEDFVDSLRTAKSLAVSLRKTGQLAEAQELTSQAYERYTRIYGASHPDSLACRLNLACDQSALDYEADAIETADQVLRVYETTLGPSHPFTLAVRNNISTYMRGVGSPRAALELADRTLDGLRSALGDDHPFALSCAINRATCLHDLARFADAEAQLRDTLDRLAKTLGNRHPDTLICQANLAVCLRSSGKSADAERLQQLVIANMRAVLGGEHPNIIALRQWRLQNRDLEVPPT